MAPVDLTTTKKLLEIWSPSQDQGGYDQHPAIGGYKSLIVLHLSSLQAFETLYP